MAKNSNSDGSILGTATVFRKAKSAVRKAPPDEASPPWKLALTRRRLERDREAVAVADAGFAGADPPS